MLIDSQFELMRVLQPFRNFESIYQGQDGDVPLAFPGDLDTRAGEPGYQVTLGAGVPMPAKGTRLKIWFPQIINNTGEGFTTTYDYAFELKWRLRNYSEYVGDASSNTPEAATPFSIKGRPFGYPVSSSDRVFLPGGADVLLYELAEPGVAGDPGNINIRTQRYRPMITTATLPLTSSGANLVWQQGVYQNGGTSAEAAGVSYSVLDVETQADELAIWVYKIDPDEDWDFTGPDEPFSYTFGNNNGARTTVNPFSGILITTGAAGS